MYVAKFTRQQILSTSNSQNVSKELQITDLLWKH